MSVKTIFKTLIGTIVIIALSSVIIEIFNVNTSGVMIQQYMQLAADNSCALYTQETFRKGSYSGATSEVALFAADGTPYSGGVGGDFHKFYGTATDSEAIWHSLYGTASDGTFKNEINEIYNNATSMISANYSGGGTVASRIPELESLKLVADQKGQKKAVTVPTNIWNLSENSMDYINYVNKTRANTYVSNLYTPVNLGIPYIDKKVATRMFKWNLTQLLSNCNSGNIVPDDNGMYYVNFKGFAVYTQQAQITNFTYHLCDLNTADGVQKLKDMTGIDGNNLSLKKVATNSPFYEKISNNIVYVVEVDYTVPVDYVGITPVKNVFNYFFNRDKHIAAGYDGVQGNNSMKLEYKVDNTGIFDSTQSGNGKLSIGKLYYTLVR